MAPDLNNAATFSTILVVEDDVVLRGLIMRALGDAGYPALAVPDGRAALKQINEEQIGLVLTDIYMPKMDGVELVTALRRFKPYLPIIVITGGYRQKPDPVQNAVRHLGVRRILEKPFSLQTLLESVGEVLGPPPARR
jgi:CheY-like chemotaxis protein